MWRRKKFDHSIVVLGAGFAGLECAKRLERKLRGRAGVHVALVDKENHSVFQPLLPEVASAAIASHHVVNPVRALAPRVDFDCAEIDRIDLDGRKIHFKSAEGIELMPMPFTQLVIALGQVPNMGVIPGLAAHGHAMKTVGDAYHLRNHVIGRMELAANTADEALRAELLTVVTVGSGFSGVETCAELHDMMVAALRYFPELQGARIRSVLLSSTERILPALSPSLSEYARRALEKRGIEVLLKVRASSLTPRACFLNDGRSIATRTVISTVGSSPHPVLLAAGLTQKGGRLLVDEHMRCQGRDEVWAIGDCARVVNSADGNECPPTAQFAVRQGAQCAENVVRALDGQPQRPFSFKQLGYAASLGHLSAVVEIGFVRLSGFIAWWVWRTIYLLKLPGWYRKLKVAIDWTVALFFPRDICQLGTARSGATTREHYEPGQIIVAEGEPGHTFYSVASGEVEVVQKDGAGEKLLARLGPGCHFGEEALLTGKPRSATVRAACAVDVLCVGRRDFDELARNIAVLGQALAREKEQRKQTPPPEKTP